MFFGPRDGCRAKAQLLSGWVLRVNAQPGSVLLWPAAATWYGKSRKLWGSWIAVREVGRRQRLCRVLMGQMSSSVGDARGMAILAGGFRSGVGMEGMRWAGTHDGERLQRDVTIPVQRSAGTATPAKTVAVVGIHV